jgi:hypothetical protein
MAGGEKRLLRTVHGAALPPRIQTGGGFFASGVPYILSPFQICVQSWHPHHIGTRRVHYLLLECCLILFSLTGGSCLRVSKGKDLASLQC